MLVPHPYCDKPTVGGGRYLTILGPGLSGSLDSLLQFAKRTESAPNPLPVDGRTRIAIDGYCLVSSATTAASNLRVVAAASHTLQLVPLAVLDSSKLTALRTVVVDGLDIKPERVAFLAEATTFGNEVCRNLPAEQKEQNAAFCKATSVVSFPANIADVRYGMHQKSAAAKAKAPVDLPQRNDYLPLEDGAENGSEFPESQQSRLTISSIDRRLDAAFKSLEQQRARVVVVVATDVRDRLFLFERLRERLPQALLVDFEADHLLAHPDFVNASRGALVLASSLFLEINEKIPESGQTRWSFWATDRQKLLYDAVSLLGNERMPEQRLPDPQRGPTLHLIGLESLHPLVGTGSADNDHTYWWLSLTLLTLLLLAYVIFLRKAGSAALIPLPLFAAFACVLANPNSWLPVLIAATLLGTAIWHVLSIARDIGRPLSAGTFRTWVIAGIVALLVLLLFSAGSTSKIALIDLRLMHTLNFDPYSGLANGLVAMLGASLLPFAIAVVASRGALKLLSQALFRASETDPLPIGELAQVPPAKDASGNSESSFGTLLKMLAGTIAAVIFLTRFIAYVNGGWRVTVSGIWAAAIASVVIVGASLGALGFLTFGLIDGRRLLVMRARLRWISQIQQDDGAVQHPEPITKLWTPERASAPHFAATPAAVRLRDAGEWFDAEETGVKKFGAALRSLLIDRKDTTANRKALFILLASEIETTRASLIAAALCASAAVLVVYLFPTTFGDQFMLLNLALLAVVGLAAAVLAMRYERDALLSNILCNRPAKVEFSFTLFLLIAQPFVLLAIAIAVTRIPGVLDWGGGLIELLMRTVGRTQT